jgi:predicted RNA-binding protein with PIN domain
VSGAEGDDLPREHVADADSSNTAAAVLLEPARQRLLVIAADVLGHLPPEEIPQPLRPIARFAPAKRARLGAAALSAALDADEAFRGKVAEVVADATPQLVEAVREGSSTAASDPVDVAVVAYLERPDGWADVLAAANARVLAETGSSDRAADELARLRDEVSELRGRMRSATQQARDDLVAATAEANAEAAEVRRELRRRTGELRAAERARDAALSELADLRSQQQALDSARDAETRRLRARITDLERAGESARRDVRADRDLDEARLWLLVDTLSDAAAGIRRELSLAPPALSPADAVADAATAAPAAPARRADDPAAVERLLALPNVHLILDGYNVTKTGYPDLPLETQRSRLIGTLAALAARSGAEVTVAFDGGTRPPAQPPVPRGVRVLFSARGEIADDLIRRLVAAEPPGRPLVVVTSDQQVVTDVLAAGAWTVPSAVFLSRLG